MIADNIIRQNIQCVRKSACRHAHTHADTRTQTSHTQMQVDKTARKIQTSQLAKAQRKCSVICNRQRGAWARSSLGATGATLQSCRAAFLGMVRPQDIGGPGAGGSTGLPQLPHATRSCQFHPEGSFSGLGCLCFLRFRFQRFESTKICVVCRAYASAQKTPQTLAKTKVSEQSGKLALVRRSLESTLNGELPLMCFPASFLLAGVPLLRDIIVSAATPKGTHLAFLFVGTRLGSASKVWLLQQIIERIQRIRGATTCAQVCKQAARNRNMEGKL